MQQALDWLTQFVWTVALELPVYVALLRGRLPGARQACLLVLAVNLLTHPALVLAGPGAGWELLGAELIVAVVEAAALTAWLGRSALPQAAVASLGANLVSTLAGLALSAWLAR